MHTEPWPARAALPTSCWGVRSSLPFCLLFFCQISKAFAWWSDLMVEHAETFLSLFAVDMDAALEVQPPDTWDSFPLFQLLNDFLRTDCTYHLPLLGLTTSGADERLVKMCVCQTGYRLDLALCGFIINSKTKKPTGDRLSSKECSVTEKPSLT